MKKHRTFLVSYGLWLGVIFALFMVFDTPQENKHSITDQHPTVCEARSDRAQKAGTKCPEKWSCDANRPKTATTLN